MEVTQSGEWSLGIRLIVQRLHCAIKESGNEANHRGITLCNIAGGGRRLIVWGAIKLKN